MLSNDLETKNVLETKNNWKNPLQISNTGARTQSEPTPPSASISASQANLNAPSQQAPNQSSFLNIINKNNRSGSIVSSGTTANMETTSDEIASGSASGSTTNQKDPDAQSSGSSQSNTLIGK